MTCVLPSGRRNVDLAALAHLGEPLRELVRVADRRRHELGRLVARVAEHQALIAGALLLVEALALGHALRDVGRLRLDRREHGAGVAVEAHLRARVADVAESSRARSSAKSIVALGRDLTGDDDEARLARASRTRRGSRVLRQTCVEDGVGDRVADLVGMTFGDGLGGKEVTGHYWT